MFSLHTLFLMGVGGFVTQVGRVGLVAVVNAFKAKALAAEAAVKQAAAAVSTKL